jgi:hypothetical protein
MYKSYFSTSIAKPDAGIGFYAKFYVRTMLVLNMPSHFSLLVASSSDKEEGYP